MNFFKIILDKIFAALKKVFKTTTLLKINNNKVMKNINSLLRINILFACHEIICC